MITRTAKTLLIGHSILDSPPIPTNETPYVAVRSSIPCWTEGVTFYPIVYSACLPGAKYSDYWLSIPYDNKDFVGCPEKRWFFNGDGGHAGPLDSQECSGYRRGSILSPAGSVWGGKIILARNADYGSQDFASSWRFNHGWYGGDTGSTYADEFDVSQFYQDGKIKTIYTGFWNGHGSSYIHMNAIGVYKALMAPNFEHSQNVKNAKIYLTEDEVTKLYALDCGDAFSSIDYPSGGVILVGRGSINPNSDRFTASLEITI